MTLRGQGPIFEVVLRLVVVAAFLAGCGSDEPHHSSPDAGTPADAAAADAAPDTDAGREAWECTCEGDEDCAACIANIGDCCYEGDVTIGGQAERLSGTCKDDGACHACCNECAAKSCEELLAAGACPPINGPPWPHNGITIDNGLLGVIGAAPLSTEGLAANEAIAPQLGDPNFHKFVSYLVQCALPEDTVVVVEGEELPGGIGLAPEWADGPCEEACQEWISACLLSRTNTYMVTVQLYLSSDNEYMVAADAADGEDDRYRTPEEEGAFWGNLFVEPPLEYACRGRGHDPLLGTFRVCAGPGNRCGIQDVGACGELDGDTSAPSMRHACEGYDPETGTFTRCHDRASLPGSDDFPAGTRTYERIFTTAVAHTAFQEGYADACPSAEPRAPFAPDDLPGTAGAICDNDDDCAADEGFHCDARNTQGLCSQPCQDSPDPGTEEEQCGDDATCFALTIGGEGHCTAACTPRTRGGDCGTAQICTNGWLFLPSSDEPGCRPFCSGDAECSPNAYCNRFGGCGSPVDMDALADGEPCSFPEGSNYPDELCRGACIRFDSVPTRGHCASLINLAVTNDCPDSDMPLITGGDDLALCAYERCTSNDDCTAPMECVDTPRGQVCDFPPT